MKRKASLKGKLSLNKENLSTLGKDSLKKILGGAGATTASTTIKPPSSGSNYTCWQTFYSTCCSGGSGSDTI